MRIGRFSWLRRRPPRWVAIATAGTLVAAGAVLIPATAANAAPGCSVTYTKQWDNGSGFGAGIEITNTGDPITGWNLTFAFPGNQQVDNGWPVAFAQSGNTVTISSNAQWNEQLNTGQTFVVGFNGSYSGQNVDPTSFSLNGTTCGAVGTPTLVVTPTTVSVPEGGVATFSVRLSSAPSGTVTVTSTRTAGDSDITVAAGGTLTFTPQNFGTTQNVTLAAAQDADTTNGTATITVSATGGIASTTVTAIEADDDSSQSIVVDPTALSVPEGGSAAFGVRLASQPSSNVTVTCAVDASGDPDITVSGGTLTFTPQNYATVQNVTVNAAEDSDTTNGTRLVNCSSSGLVTVSVSVTEADNDSGPAQAIVVTPTSVSVPEGGTATFGVRLAAQPSGTVTVTCTAGSGDSDITVVAGTGTKTFTSTTWNTDQNVTLAAAEDADTTNGTRTISCSSTGLTTVSVTATEDDNDSAQAIIVSPTAVSVPEGSTAVFGVRLAAQPSSNVTVTCTADAGDSDITVVAGTGTKTFTPANFGTEQDVTLAAAEDDDEAHGVRTIVCSSTGLSPATVTATEIDNDAADNQYITEFLIQYDKIKNPANGYFSPEGIPYHSIETLLVEAPDHGHETTSEAFSFWMWLEAIYGRVTGNWAPFNNAWNITEQYIIPTQGGQPGGQTSYNPSDPADYAPEFNQPSQYPSPLSTSVSVGQDPLAAELQSTYGNRFMYAMHWLIDVDNVYGFGNGRGSNLTECGDNTERVTYINTYQRGPQESVWETVPHPSCDTQRFGSAQGFPPLFIQGSSGNQWRYTNAPDADARAVQAAYWALTWATEQNNQSQISASIAKAAKMGDFLRYAMYDKYFKNPGCTDPNCTAGSGKSSSNWLLSWYFSWGGDNANAWSWRIGSSHNHFGYQNPFAAWVMSEGPTALRPLSPTADDDWAQSLTRQLQFYGWLQSAEGAIAGGATNSWDGAYATPPAGTPTFFGLAYDVDPVYHDPPSNQWFGFQAWSMHRVAELYNVTGDTRAKALLDKWVDWATDNTTLGSGSTFSIPNEMSWSGAPAGNFSSPTGMPPANPNLHVTITSYGNDIGVTAAYVRTLLQYAAREGNTELGLRAKDTAKGLLDRMLLLKEDKGISVCESRGDYDRFDDVWSSSNQQGLYIPSGFNGTMPNGDVIQPGSTFLSIRSFYTTDQTPTCTGGPGSGIAAINAYMAGTGPAPEFRYHRFWAQADAAMALAEYGLLFPNG
jgi:hypothetical protein